MTDVEDPASLGMRTDSQATSMTSTLKSSARSKQHTQTPLHAVQTKDSVGTITMTAMAQEPGLRASAEEKKAYLETQLDSLVGTTVLERMVVLGGHTNRLTGGGS